MVRLRNLRSLRGERYFEWRGGDVSRVEGLTDAVLALAMTLLIVSLEVPRDFDSMIESFKQLPAFAVCFTLLVMLWRYHFQFHRRFGLENTYTIWLNAALLFLILFYVYPLKFVFTTLFDHVLFDAGGFDQGEAVTIMILYSGGYAAIFALFAFMHTHAYRHRDVLGLDDVERQVTIGTIREHWIHVGFGAVSVALTVFVHPSLAGLVYFFVGPVQGLNGWRNGRKVERLAAAPQAQSPA